MEDYELTLFDRLEVIKNTNDKYDLENNAYISFSGGKDSTVLHHLIDMALPNNRIPRVFINTGIEYSDIVKFVQEMAENDDRIIMLKPTLPIKQTLEKYGYPLKSKQHSHDLAIYQRSGMTTTVRKYLSLEKGNDSIVCPRKLRHHFTEDFKVKVSEFCCIKLKKEPIAKWQKKNNRTISIIGVMKNEGGQRMNHDGCVVFDTKDTKKLVKFKPLNPITQDFEKWFIEKNNIKLCKLYYPPFNFKRTGCKGCPFSLDLQEQLEIMEKYLPNEKKQCEAIWKPIYEEYRKIGYRLQEYKQLNLFEDEVD